MSDVKPYKIDLVSVDDLRLDLQNPRFIGMNFANEEEIMKFLIDEADVTELLLSIINSGYLDFEPIVVKADDLTVLEGNRRLAALRLIRDKEFREKLGVKLPLSPEIMHDPIKFGPCSFSLLLRRETLLGSSTSTDPGSGMPCPRQNMQPTGTIVAQRSKKSVNR